MPTKRNWRQRLEDYQAGATANEEQRRITVSKARFESAQNHEVWINPKTSGPGQSLARVRSATSDATYSVDLWVDEAKIFPTFPYVWKCNCKWGRERFDPCSHVIAVALERGKRYENEYGVIDRARETGSQADLGIAT
jgi:hypothetical protein